MKKIATYFALLIIPTLANASPFTNASLQDISVSVSSGYVPSIDSNSFYGQTYATLNSNQVGDVVHGISESFISTSTMNDGSSYSTAMSNYSLRDSSSGLYSDALAFDTSYVTSTTFAKITFQYFANSSLYFSAYATVSALPGNSNESAFSFAKIELKEGSNSLGYDLLYVDSYNPDLAQGKIGFSFSSDEDKTLTFTAQVLSSSLINPVSTVPEVNTSAMMFAGLLFMAISAFRRAS